MIAERRIGPTYPTPEGAASVRGALRALRRIGAVASVAEPSLERRPVAAEPPRLQRAQALDAESVSACRVSGEATVGIAAFLDGIQESRVLAHVAGGLPVVLGTVAATVRHRAGRTLVSWRPDATVVERALFVPRVALGEATWSLLARDYPVHDTIDSNHDGNAGPWHPMDFTARALTAVQRRREALETQCAELWCREGDGPLYVDGGIASAGAAARSPLAIGVVKSHRTLYVDGDALPLVLGLGAGERTTPFTVTSPHRPPVASWYLRLRAAASGDPLWGLVRVEVTLDGATAERCDIVSRWLLAERSPVALPDARWGAMAYGIRLTEEYLRAITR